MIETLKKFAFWFNLSYINATCCWCSHTVPVSSPFLIAYHDLSSFTTGSYTIYADPLKFLGVEVGACIQVATYERWIQEIPIGAIVEFRPFIESSCCVQL